MRQSSKQQLEDVKGILVGENEGGIPSSLVFYLLTYLNFLMIINSE